MSGRARRTFSRLVLAAIAITVAGAGAAAADWPEFRGDATNSGLNPNETVISAANVGSLTSVWTGTTGSVVQSSPAVANGSAYVGSDDGKLYAFDAAGLANCAPGAPRACGAMWTGATGGPVRSSPAVANGLVYVGSDDGKLYAFDAAGLNNCSVGPQPRTCLAQWVTTTGGTVSSSPTVVNDVVYVGSSDDRLYAMNATTGQILWVTITGGDVESSPAVTNGVAFVGSNDTKIVAMNATTGQILWSTLTGGAVSSSPAVTGGVVYVGSFDNRLYALNATTGQILWSTITGPAPTSPAVANGVVYVGSGNGQLSALDAATGAVQWSAAMGAVVRSSPAVANGLVYVGADNGALSVFDAAGTVNCGGAPKTCTPLRTVTLGGNVSSSPAVADGVVYVGSGDHKLYALAPPLATPTVATQASPGNLLGAPVHDTATLAGGTSPTGAITFRLYGPNDATCAGPPVFTTAATVAGNGSYPSTSFTPSAAGTYRWTADYSGDRANNPASSACNAANESVTIAPFQPPPCTRSLTGDVVGPITVSAGESVCIAGARVTGPVTVQAGGALTVTGSRITNGLTATAPAFFSLCGSQVAAPAANPSQGVVVSGAGVPVRIGDPSAGCAANRVAGNVSLTSNAAGVTVAANIVSGTLACSGNVPPPTNAGQPNTAGTKTGQCAGL